MSDTRQQTDGEKTRAAQQMALLTQLQKRLEEQDALLAEQGARLAAQEKRQQETPEPVRQGLIGLLNGGEQSETAQFMRSVANMEAQVIKNPDHMLGLLVRASEFTPVVEAKGLETWMRSLLVMTLDPDNAQADPCSVWQVTTHEASSGEFILKQCKVAEPKSVTVSLRQLSECYLVRAGGWLEVKASLEDKPGEYPIADRILTVDVRREERLQKNVYALMHTAAPYGTAMAFMVDTGSTGSRGPSSDEADKKARLPAAFHEAAKIGAERAKRLSSEQVFRALTSGSLHEPPQDYFNPRYLNMSHAAAERLVEGTGIDVRNFQRVDWDIAEKLQADKTSAAVLPVRVSLDGALDMYREFIAVSNDVFNWTEAVLGSMRAVERQVRQLAEEQRPINFEFEKDNSVLELLNRVIRKFFAAITYSQATTAEVRTAVANFRIDGRDTWVQITLQAIKERRRVEQEELQHGEGRGIKRDREDAVGSGGRVLEDRRATGAGGGKRFCFLDFTTQDDGRIVGCTKGGCHFNHVRGKRALTAAEVVKVKEMIEQRNTLIASDIAQGQTGRFLLEENTEALALEEDESDQ